MGTQPSSKPAPTGQGVNLAVLLGALVAAPEYRTLPSGTIAASFSLTIRAPDIATTSVPVVWYDPPKRLMEWVVGDSVVVTGSVVRRFFRGAGGLGSSTEVVVAKAELWRHPKKVRALIGELDKRRDLLLDAT